MSHVVVTGGAGFIGGHLCARLLDSGHQVTAVDSFDPFYPASVKRAGIAPLLDRPGFRLLEADVRDLERLQAGIRSLAAAPDVVVHLAARPGVRPSIDDPVLYSSVNVGGTASVLELARRLRVRRFVFGSSSSVYGNHTRAPVSESDSTDAPISPYAATKRAGELLCHAQHHLHGMSVACLRFFTVYGPRQRPDLAIHKFTRLMAEGRPVPIYGDGETARDYTYVDDIVQGIEGAIRFTAADVPRFEVFNLGGSRTVSLARLVELLGAALDVEPILDRLPAQPGDVVRTHADVSKAQSLLGYTPSMVIEDGILRFVDWYRACSPVPLRNADSAHG